MTANIAAPPMIDMRALTKRYPLGGRTVSVLDGVDLRVEPGEVVALVGRSGSGKSTLLNIIGCLDRPTQGDYVLGGREVSRLDRSEQAWVRLHFVGCVFQSFHLIPHATALENVALPLHYAGKPRAWVRDRARELLDRVGLADRAEHRPSELSGGEQQRVAIARACVMRPRLLLADEPTGALDTRRGEDVLQLLDDLQREQRMTMVIVTHDPHVASFAQRTVTLRDGRIAGADEEGRDVAG